MLKKILFKISLDAAQDYKQEFGSSKSKCTFLSFNDFTNRLKYTIYNLYWGLEAIAGHIKLEI